MFSIQNVLVIAQYKPTDATTNPSLLYAAAQIAEYKPLIDDAIKFARGQSRYDESSLASLESKELGTHCVCARAFSTIQLVSRMASFMKWSGDKSHTVI